MATIVGNLYYCAIAQVKINGEYFVRTFPNVTYGLYPFQGDEKNVVRTFTLAEVESLVIDYHGNSAKLKFIGE